MGKVQIVRTLPKLVLLLVALAMVVPAFGGDSLYGKVTEVKSANVVVFDYGEGQYELTLVGIDVPTEPADAAQATAFVSKMVLAKNARMAFDHRTPDGQMLARLFTDDPDIGINDVAIELVRVGLARRQKDFDFKYGELAAAEEEARSAGRGLWSRPQPK